MDAWLKAALDYVPRWLDYQMQRTEQPGCAVAVAHKGRVVLEQAFGYADAVRRRPLTPRHRFRVASHSKTFTAAAIMKLREAGKLRLDDPVGRYVDALHPTVAATTLSQLLSHSAGLIRDGVDGGQWQDRRPFLSERELREALAQQTLLPASTRFKYSNYGYGLVGLVIEAVTGESYNAWVGREIVAAAKLRETTTDGPVAKDTPIALGHTRKLPAGRLIVPGDNPTNVLAPATGFVSTAGDLARFFGSLDPHARHCILTPSSRREMTRRLWRDPHAIAQSHYGLGIMHGKAGAWDWFGHAGGFQSCISRTAVLPGRDLAVTVLTNAVDGFAHPWSDGLIRILQTFARHGAPTAKTRAWSGRWWSHWRTLDFVPMRDRVLVADPGFAVPFAEASEVTVNRRDHGTISQATALGNYGEEARLVRGKNGTVREVWFGGTKYLPEARLAAELKRRYGN